MLDKVKLALRIKTNALDEDINDYIEAAKESLNIAGVTSLDENNPLIIQAVKIYCKANLTTDNIAAERYNKSFETLKQSLSLCSEYNGGNFNV